MAIRALIFDVDGTLAETEELHRRAFNETFAEYGLGWHWDRALYRELLKTTGGKERMLAHIRNNAPATRPPEDAIPAIHRRKTARYVELVAEGALELRPGIRELMEDARARGVRLAVATTTNLPNVEALCRACFGQPADAVFDVIAAGDQVKAKKPAPDVYELALARLGLAARDCVALEDSLNGLLSAKGAGLRCIVSPGPYTEGQDFSLADAVAGCFSEFPAIKTLEDALNPDTKGEDNGR
jgi:HAD superfamily hydrolase (TIGR01509 family)